MNTTGSRYALQRRIRRELRWGTICASDNLALMRKLFDDQRRIVKHGGLRLVDQPTEAVIEKLDKPDYDPETREADL
jgi:hypothetical protein